VLAEDNTATSLDHQVVMFRPLMYTKLKLQLQVISYRQTETSVYPYKM